VNSVSTTPDWMPHNPPDTANVAEV
jgi:hypothetical protein